MTTNRVTMETFYRQTLHSMLRRKQELLQLNEQISSGSRVNRPSDDSVASISVHSSYRKLEEIRQYDANLDHARDWLQQADSSMSAMNDLIAMAKERAEQMSTGTYTSDQREMVAQDVSNILAELVTQSNAKVGADYIFSGTRTGTPAASLQMSAQNPAVQTAGTSPGELWGQGVYTGVNSREVTLTVNGFGSGAASGTPGVAGETMEVGYSYVDDFGRTVSGTVTLSGTGTGNAVAVGDGVQIYARDAQKWDPATGTAVGSYDTGDQFALTVGRHRGNDEELAVNLSWNNRMAYNYSLEELFRGEGWDGSQYQNVLDLLGKWNDALRKDNVEQDWFEALPGGLNPTNPDQVTNPNNPSSTAQVRVDGDWQSILIPDPADPASTVQKYQTAEEFWDDLKAMSPEFNVGAPVVVSSEALDETTLDGRNFRFYLDETTNPEYNGIPSASEPMELRVAWESAPATWTDIGTGTVTITGTGPEATATFTDPVTGDNVEVYVANMSFISEDIAPADPLANIDAWNGVGAPPGGTYYGPTFYDPETDPNQTAADVTVTYQTAPGVRRHQTISVGATGSNNQQGVDIDGDGQADFSFYLSEDGLVDDGDYHRLSLEQYHNGQQESQKLLSGVLDMLASVQANLLKYQADAGAKLNRLDVRENLLGGDNLRLNERLEQTQDADVTQVVTDLKSKELLYQASLQATAFISSRTLADYI
jgi:flagellar hook-associated protein 3 FlgL